MSRQNMDLRRQLLAKQVTPEMTMTELIQFHPAAFTVFNRYGMTDAVFVPYAVDERTIQEVCDTHGRNAQEIVAALNLLDAAGTPDNTNKVHEMLEKIQQKS